MMLPATQTSCLKDGHTNFKSNVGIGITYFGERLQFVCKTSAGNIKSICLKYGHTNFCFNLGISMRYFWKLTMFVLYV